MHSPFGSTGAATRRHRFLIVPVVGVAAVSLVAGGVIWAGAASAAQPAINLGTSASFAVLAGTTVTNTGPSVISGDVGVSPGTAITGFPPAVLIAGSTEHSADGVAGDAQSDLTTAYNTAAGAPSTATVSADLGNHTLVAGVYTSASSLGLTGDVTLDGQNDPSSVFVFQAGSTLTTASNSTVSLINGAQACNVFWQVGSSAVLGTDTTFVGNILALASASLNTGATLDGRVLARNGAVTLDTNTITAPSCATTPPPATPVAPITSVATTPAGGTTPSATPGTPTAAPTGSTTGTGSSTTGTGTEISATQVVPAGSPHTGAGGASLSTRPALVAAGLATLLGAVVLTAAALRRRRHQLAASPADNEEMDG